MNYIMRNIGIKAGFLFVVLALALGLTSCEKDYTDAVSGSEEVVMVSSDAQNYPLTIHATKDAWKATSSASWLVIDQIEGVGTRDIELVIAQNITSITRTAHIDVKMQSGASTRITVKQSGLGSTQIRLIPELITAKPYATSYAFRVSLQNAPASQNDLSYEITEGKDWLSFVRVDAVPSSSFLRSFDFFFTPSNNLNADGREATVVFTIRYNHKVYTLTGTFYQNGLGAPAVATAENAYMRHNQTTHSQSVWLSEGNRDNVNFAKPVVTSTQSGTNEGSSTDLGGWITDATIDNNGILTVTAQANTYSEPREGEVYIVASRTNNPQLNDKPGAATAKMRVHVIQAAHKSPGVSMPVSEVVHNYKANTYNLPLQSINDSKITASLSTVTPWITGVSIGAANQLVYTMAEFAGGQVGESREATITIVAANGASNKASYYLTVRQYAPSMPGLDLISKMMVNFKENTYTVNANPINGSVITEAYSMNSDWLTEVAISANKSNIAFKVGQYTGGEAGESREGVIVVVVKNDHANLAYYYLTVTQSAPQMPGLSVPTSDVTLNYTASKYDMVILGQNNSVVTTTTNVNWISGVTYDGAKLEYNVSMFDGGQVGEAREGQIFLTATNSHSNSVVYSITIKQFAPSMPALDLPAQKAVHNHTANNYVLDVNALNDAKIVSVSSSSNWITATNSAANVNVIDYALTAYPGGQEGGSREGHIVILVENNHKNQASYYFHIQQNAPQMPSMSLPTAAVTHTHAAGNNALVAVLQNGAKVDAVQANAAWIKNVAVANSALTYDYDAYTGGEEGDFREGQIMVELSNANANKVAYTVTVRQYAPSSAGISTPVSQVTHDFTASAYTLPLTPINNSTLTAQTSNSWIKSVVIGANNVLSYELDAYAGGQNGTTREGVIAINATNSNANHARFYIQVVQYAPSMPSVEGLPEMLNFNADDIIYEMPLFGVNKAKISMSFSAPWATSVEEIPAAWGEYAFVILMPSYDGAQGPYRECMMHVVATNSNSESALYSIPVRQYAPAVAGMSTPLSNITHSYAAAAGNKLSLQPFVGSMLTASSDAAWLTNVAVDSTTNMLNYDVASYAGGIDGASRQGTIIVTATNNSVYTALYYITITQYAPERPELSQLPDYIGLSGGDLSMMTIEINPINNAVPTVSVSDDTWMSATINEAGNLEFMATSQFTGGVAPMFYREGVITVKATNSGANAAFYYIPVRQYNIQTASVPQIADGATPENFIARSGVTNHHVVLVNPENVTMLSIDANHAAVQYPAVDDDYGVVSSIFGYLSFSSIMPSSFDISASRNIASYRFPNGTFLGENRSYNRYQQVSFCITYANQMTVVQTQNIYQN